jgi:hypothetical protein
MQFADGDRSRNRWKRFSILNELQRGDDNANNHSARRSVIRSWCLPDGEECSEPSRRSHCRRATMQIRTASQRFDAELLEVRSNGIVVARKNDGQIAMVPWTSTRSASAKGLGREYAYGVLIPPSRDVLPNLVKVSHFPQGMTPEIEARILASRGQKEIVVIQ